VEGAPIVPEVTQPGDSTRVPRLSTPDLTIPVTRIGQWLWLLIAQEVWLKKSATIPITVTVTIWHWNLLEACGQLHMSVTPANYHIYS
jgi:hypothetical protein